MSDPVPGTGNIHAEPSRGEQPLNAAPTDAYQTVGHVPPPPSGGPSQPYAAPYPPYPSAPGVGGLSTNTAAGLAYVTVIPAIILLLIDPYRRNEFIRFHCWQSIFYFVAVAAVRVLELIFVSMLPSWLAVLTSGLLSLLLFVGWLVAIIKAFQGERWMLPVVGEYAARSAASAP